jgi:hypothetical protein
MWPICEPIAAGILVSLWSKFVLPALFAQCQSEREHQDDIVSETSAISSDIEVHMH